MWMETKLPMFDLRGNVWKIQTGQTSQNCWKTEKIIISWTSFKTININPNTIFIFWQKISITYRGENLSSSSSFTTTTTETSHRSSTIFLRLSADMDTDGRASNICPSCCIKKRYLLTLSMLCNFSLFFYVNSFFVGIIEKFYIYLYYYSRRIHHLNILHYSHWSIQVILELFTRITRDETDFLYCSWT